MVFKQYNQTISDRYKIFPSVFDVLKKIDNDHLIKIIDLYTKSYFGKFIVDGYTTLYYEEDTMNPFLKYTDYLLDNFFEIEQLFNYFSANHILTDDVRRDNTILGKDKIIIVDPDQFLVTCDSIRYISIINKRKLAFLFRNIMMKSITDLNNPGNLRFEVDKNLFNFELNPDTDLTNEISKRLSKYRYPIELLNK